MPLSRWTERTCSKCEALYQEALSCAGSAPPISTARSRKSAKLRTGMLAPFQSWTDLRPASRSRQTVSSSGSVLSSVVLPMPGGPKMASEVLFEAAERRSSALMMRRAMGTPG